MFLDRVGRVTGRGAEEIAKHGSGLIEGYLVLAEILGRFPRIPLELHAFNVARPDDFIRWLEISGTCYTRNVRELIGGPQYPVSERRRYGRHVAGNEQTDRFEIIGSLGRPPYFSHLAMRWRISS